MSYLNGIDVSQFQKTTPSLAGLSFIVVKATDGTATDPMYATHTAAGRRAGLSVQAYHFGYSALSGVSIARQVAAFLAIAHTADFHWVDVERSAFPMTAAEAGEFVALMHVAGYKNGLYASLYSPTTGGHYPNVGQDARWVAAYGFTSLPIPWDFWQVADTYLGSGAGGDSDRFNGDAAALAALIGGTTGGINLGGSMALAPITDNTHGTVQIPAGETQFLEDAKTVDTVKTVGGSVWSPFATKNAAGVVLRAFEIVQTVGQRSIRFAAPVAGSFVADASGLTQAQLDAAVAAAKTAGAQHEWDREFTGTAGAKIIPLPRP